MPLTVIQRAVMQDLAACCSPESQVAGGSAINRSSSSPRYSADIDFFHDLADSVHICAEADVGALIHAGYAVEWLLRQPYLHRATVQRENERLKLRWYDSAFRFFPTQPDPELGYSLHPADLAANKVLALAGRSEIRDLIDILNLNDSYLSLGAVCWAACGKDRGYNPIALLEAAKKQTKFRVEDLASEQLAQPITLADLKEKWQHTAVQAEELIKTLPGAEMGCLYLTPAFAPVTPVPADPDFPRLVRHYGSIRGAWPVLSA